MINHPLHNEGFPGPEHGLSFRMSVGPTYPRQRRYRCRHSWDMSRCNCHLDGTHNCRPFPSHRCSSAGTRLQGGVVNICGLLIVSTLNNYLCCCNCLPCRSCTPPQLCTLQTTHRSSWPHNPSCRRCPGCAGSSQTAPTWYGDR